MDVYKQRPTSMIHGLKFLVETLSMTCMVFWMHLILVKLSVILFLNLLDFAVSSVHPHAWTNWNLFFGLGSLYYSIKCSYIRKIWNLLLSSWGLLHSSVNLDGLIGVIVGGYIDLVKHDCAYLKVVLISIHETELNSWIISW